MKPISRRSFLRRAAAGGAAFLVVPRHVLGGAGFTPPSEVLNHAIIGCGGMGQGHIGYVLGEAKRGLSRLAALCDVDREHLARSLKKAPPDCTGHHDFREVLAREDIDVVHIVTPPHWHAPMAIAAAEAGKDIFCEKPMTRTIGEARKVADAVQRKGRIFRLNTWFRLYGDFYGLGCTVKPVKKLVAGGLLGWPLLVRVSRHTGFNWKVSMWCGKIGVPPEPVPEALDYDFWLGPAPFKPYFRHRTHGSFRGYWDYDGGGLSDMGQHYLDPVQYILGKDGESPVRVEAEAPWPPHPDAVRLWGRVELAYRDGCRILLESCEWGPEETKGKPYIEGPEGKLFPGFKTDPPSLAEKVKELPDPDPQLADFDRAVRTRKKFGLNEENGHRSNLLVHLANAAIRTGRVLRFDSEKERFIDDPGAERLVDQPMRAPWTL